MVGTRLAAGVGHPSLGVRGAEIGLHTAIAHAV